MMFTKNFTTELFLVDRRPRNPFQHTRYLSLCMKFPSYLRKRTQLCKNVQDTMLGLVLLNGTKRATRECQQQFQGRRWNCSDDPQALEAIMTYGKFYYTLIQKY